MLDPIQSPSPEQRVKRWSRFQRLTFRFCFVYLGLFCLATIDPIDDFFPMLDIDPLALWPSRQGIIWTAAHVFHAGLPLVYNTGSGDTTFDWVFLFCAFTLAAFATVVWSVLDRRHENYSSLSKWFRLFIRFGLAGQLLAYGIDKVVPLQMPLPSLTRLLHPFGDFSPMGVLWASVGASRAYEMFAGSAEVLGGVLLIFPKTAILGALVSLADMTQVFALNMSYDVPVKSFSFHLLLLSAFLLAPDARRLADFFLFDRTVRRSEHAALFSTPVANRYALAAQICFGIFLLGSNASDARSSWFLYGGGSLKSPLYGIWDVVTLSVDHQLRAPLLTDDERWRRVVFDNPEQVAFQKMDDSFVWYGASISVRYRTLALTEVTDKTWRARYRFARVSRDRLILDGNVNGKKVVMHLQLVDNRKFLLLNRGFHWIQEYPFNR